MSIEKIYPSKRRSLRPRRSSVLITILFILASCGQRGHGEYAGGLTAAKSFEQARADFAASAEKTLATARPLGAAELDRRLKLPAERLRGFENGNAAPVGAISAFRSGYMCAPGYCICHGDDDCNDLFSTVCRDPSTGGRCYDLGGGKTVCTCIPKAQS